MVRVSRLRGKARPHVRFAVCLAVRKNSCARCRRVSLRRCPGDGPISASFTDGQGERGTMIGHKCPSIQREVQHAGFDEIGRGGLGKSRSRLRIGLTGACKLPRSFMKYMYPKWVRRKAGGGTAFLRDANIFSAMGRRCALVLFPGFLRTELEPARHEGERCHARADAADRSQTVRAL